MAAASDGDPSAVQFGVKGPKRGRSPGRPRREIDPAAVADAAARLFSEGGYDAVSIEAAAEQLSVSRATLYRTVPTKDHLLGILFERSTKDLHADARALVDSTNDPADQIFGLVRLQIGAAVAMRRYLTVFFGGVGLPEEVVARWHQWTREYEDVWITAVTRAIEAGVLQRADPTLTTRLLLGMCIWVSRWYRPVEAFSAEDIADAAVQLIGRYRAETDITIPRPASDDSAPGFEHRERRATASARPPARATSPGSPPRAPSRSTGGRPAVP